MPPTQRRAQAAVPGLQLHLSAACAAADERGYLLTGPLEPTNERYAIAKIAGIKMCQAYRRQYGFDAISLMPTNLYGPGDNFDLENSHVLPALIRKFHEAKLRRRAVGRGLGHRHAAARVPVRRRSGRRVRLPDAAATTSAAPINVGCGDGHHDPRARAS